jgi:hypothetical protein
VEEVVPVVVVIIILVAWAVILGPGFIKRRALSGGDSSITNFHDQLRVLENSAPEPIVAPAYRLRAVDDSGTPTAITYPDSDTPPVLTVVGAKELPRPALAFLGEPTSEEVTAVPDTRPDRADQFDEPVTSIDRRRSYRDEWIVDTPDVSEVIAGPVDPGTGQRGLDAFTRSQARRRRRDTLSVLGVVFVTTLVFGIVTGTTAIWVICAIDTVALAAYVTLLVQLRRTAMERERKLRYLEPRPEAGRIGAGGPVTHVSGRYAHPSNQQAAAR